MGQADQTCYVQDHGHRTVAQYRGGRNSLDLTVVCLQALDDNLLLAEQIIDIQSGLLAVGFNYDEDALGEIG